MTTLDLNAYGVTEMSHAEKVAENGGWWPVVWAATKIAVAVAAYCYDNWDEMGPATEDGHAAADKLYNR